MSPTWDQRRQEIDYHIASTERTLARIARQHISLARALGITEVTPASAAEPSEDLKGERPETE